MQTRLLLLLFALPLCAFGQTPNFFVEGSRWVYQRSESFEPGQFSTSASLEQHHIQGDTVLDGVFYRKVYSITEYSTTVFPPHPQPPITTIGQGHSGPTFIRLDATENQVYYRASADSSEKVIYNFNLQVGDILPMQPQIFTPGLVDSIENVSLFGIPVRKFYTSNQPWEPTYEENYILEGMGGSNGLAYFEPMALVVSGGIFMTSLVCFQSGDSIYTRTPGECPFLELVATQTPENESLKVLVLPNPTQGAFSVQVKEAWQGTTFVVLDGLGRKVIAQDLNGPVVRGQLPVSGLYFWHLEKNGQILSAGKLIGQ